MEEDARTPPDAQSDSADFRCPDCDSIVPVGAERCIMCGAKFVAPDAGDGGTEARDQPKQTGNLASAKTNRAPIGLPKMYLASGGRPGKSLVIWLMVLLTIAGTGLASILILRSQRSQVILALQPTFTALPSAPTVTPTWTPEPSQTPLATETPVPSSTPIPTDTPRPPRYHSVSGGETLFGLSLLYRISAASIAESNNIPLNTPIQVGQELIIPWPTATPPLESMILQVGDEQLVVDVTDCEIVTIEEGDSTYGLSGRYDVPVEAIVAVNRLTDEAIQMLHPGDTLCVPVVYAGNTLPATPGAQPSPTGTSFPAGPTLLYPTNGMEIEPADGLIRLQWVAVKDLGADEWYMVEMSDLDEPDTLPKRDFTRDTSFEIPGSWRPQIAETHQLRWRVSIVKIEGQRTDGGVIYDYGGRSSEDSIFFWLGAVPTSTPTMTPTASPEPEQ